MALLGAAAAPASAQTINVDFEDPNTTAHVGADGVLSGSGTTWNPVVVTVDAFGLVDEDGGATGTDLVFLAAGSAASDPASTNDLQDRGTFRDFEIRGLDADALYDVAVYGGSFGFWTFTDAAGGGSAGCTGALTYLLPGTEGGDYCIYAARTPADLGGGNVGFRLSGLDGLITGVQVRLLVIPVPTLPPLLLAVLGVGLLGVGLLAVRRGRGGG